jgi:tetratricopeptide (TPR) repeat protein
MKTILIILFTVLFIGKCYSQTIILPIVNVKSHKTLSIEKIEFSDKQTIIFLSIENQKTEGEAWFCADKNIYIKNVQGIDMYYMTKSEGIPTCPETYKFTKPGEILQFKLIFPKIPVSIKEIDIVESCNDNCFYFRGVILDPAQNADIKLFEKGVALYSNKKADEALKCFFELSANIKDRKSNLYGYTLYIVPLIYFEKGDKENAKKEYSKLINSAISDKDYFIEKLCKEEFFNNLK